MCQMGRMDGMDGMVIIGHRSSKSTYGAHKMHFVMYTETQSNMSSGTEKLKLASNIFSFWFLKFDFYFFQPNSRDAVGEDSG